MIRTTDISYVIDVIDYAFINRTFADFHVYVYSALSADIASFNHRSLLS